MVTDPIAVNQRVYIQPQGYQNGVTVTPSDSTVFSPPLQGIYVGTAGSLDVITAGGQEVTVTVPNNAVVPLSVTKIKAASTATNIVGLY